MAGHLNLNGLIAGCSLFAGTLVAMYWAWYYYKNVPEPWKDLSKRTIVSLLLFGLGSVSVVVDSLTQTHLWFLMAIFYTLSYAAIVSTIFLSLRTAASIGKPRAVQGKNPKRKESRESGFFLRGGYSLREEPSPLLFRMLKEVSNGLVVVSRKSREEWTEKFGVQPDEFLWLSRADIGEAVDPSKLHVIQGRILQFMESRGSIVVYFDGIEYLTLYNDFSSVAKFLFAVKDMVMIKNSLMLIHIPEGIFDKKQEIILLREFEEITEEELIKKLHQALSPEKTDELALFGALPPTTKKQEGEYAGNKSPKEGSRTNKKKAQEPRTIRREEEA